ncbi:MAG TPA: cysteine desulfurase family protein [Candidatus Melainabacteria bacterium]|nr:cysteine desulfurase family protein [Candidatus Melainabacteria bacterium]
MDASIKPEYAARAIYLDNAATTAVDRRVLDAMYGVLAQGHIGNAHARHHVFGAAAHSRVEAARHQVADAIGAESGEIVFTSGATEANNLAIKGVAAHLKSQGRTHLVTSAVEHSSVLEPLRELEAQGFDLTILSVKPCGMIEADMIERALRPETGLVCVQAVNNEVGVIQPVEEIAEMLQGRGILFHCDAAQALGKTGFSVRFDENDALGVDFASLSSHKIYGPQGIGALYVRADKRHLLSAVNRGGAQEFGLRSGTLPTALCVGFGMACSLLENDIQHLRGLRWSFLKRLSWLKPTVYGHSHPDWNVPGILSIRFEGIEAETLIMALPDLAFGVGSACSSSREKLSHVVRATTGSVKAARESLRISFGRYTTHQEILRAADLIIEAVEEIRQLQGVA